MPNPAGKLWTLLMLLQSRPNRSVSELAGELDVSARTVHRYIAMLEEMGIPLYSERGRHGGFSLVRGYRLPPMMFSNPEAVALTLGLDLVGQMWGNLYTDAARSAGAKLELVLPAQQLDEVTLGRRTLFTTGLHQIDPEHVSRLLEGIHRAIRTGESLHLIYQSSEPKVSERRIDPYALVHRWGWWYLVGFCHLRESIRTFRVDRILRIDPGQEKYTLPADFEIEAYLARNSIGPRVVLSFTAEAARLAYAYRSWWDEITPQADGRVEVSFVSPDPESTAEGLLALGPGFSVLQPVELRRRLTELAQEIAANNT
jgi:predicted DNA-binding transcriptional regulator YafY